MTGLEIGAVSLACLFVLIYLGVHVAVGLMLISFISLWVYSGNVAIAFNLLSLTAREGIADYTFGVLPLFILMGILISASGIGREIYKVADVLLRKFIGGLGIATVAANTVLAATTGTSIASIVIFSKVAVPQMRAHGYSSKFAVGIVAGSSVLGMLIPPSGLLIIYAFIAEVSVRDMFLAGVVPGLVLACAFVVGIVVMAKFLPRYTTSDVKLDDEVHEDSLGFWRGVYYLMPAVIIVVVVLGGIYGGVFTATEAGAVSCLIAIILAYMKGQLKGTRFWTLVADAGRVTAALMIVILAALIYSRMLGILGIPSAFSQWLASMDVNVVGLLIIYVICLLILGTILDSASIILVIAPLFIPVVQSYGLDLVWFGIVTVIGVEIGLLTPPLGLTCYIMKGTLEEKDISLADIFLGAAPFAVIMLIVLITIIAFPQIAIGIL